MGIWINFLSNSHRHKIYQKRILNKVRKTFRAGSSALKLEVNLKFKQIRPIVFAALLPDIRHSYALCNDDILPKACYKTGKCRVNKVYPMFEAIEKGSLPGCAVSRVVGKPFDSWSANITLADYFERYFY